MKTKFFSFLLMVMLCVHSGMAVTTVTFTSTDFNGQGTSGTGSNVSATKNGITFSCDKGYGAQSAVRCYKDASVSISSSSTVISSINFEFETYNNKYYNGGLSENVAVNDYSWQNTMASQARMTSITVYLSDASSQPVTSGIDSEGFAYISDFTYASDLISYDGAGGFSSIQNPSLSMLKANVFCVEDFYGLSEGQSSADFDVYKNTSLVKLGEFNFCWEWYRLSLGEGSSKSFDFTYAYDNMNVGDTKVITSDEGTIYTIKLIDKVQSTIDSEKKIAFSVDRPLYFGGIKNGSVGISNFRDRVQVKYVSDINITFTGPTDISQYTDEGIEKVFSNDNNINIPITYLAYENNTSGSIMNCIVIQSPSGVEYNLYSPDLYNTNSSNAYDYDNTPIVPYLYEANGYIYIDLQRKEAGTWHLMLVQEYAGNWLYYNNGSPSASGESTFWNFSDAAFNSLGTISSTTIVNGLTIHASSDKKIVIDEGSVREIDGLSFSYRLKLGGTGSKNTRVLSFPVSGDCDIDVYLISASSTGDRVLNVDSDDGLLQQIPAPGSDISKGTVHYVGEATTIYLYSPSSGVNIYAIRVNYGGSSSGERTVTQADLASYEKSGYYVACFQAPENSTCNDIVWAGSYNNWATDDVSQLVHCDPLPNFPGWYVAVVPTGNDNSGKPVQLDECGLFNWDNQCGGINEVALLAGYVYINISINGDAECNLDYWSSNEPTIIKISSWKNGANPCSKTCSPKYTINIVSANSEWGSASGSTTVDYLSQIIISASANYGYHFTQWNDGNTENPRTITVTEDATYTASFAKNNYTISTTTSNPSWGNATGGKTAPYLDQITITANANYGYHFTQWNDGNTENPRTITVTENETFIASFAKNNYTVTTTSENPSWGSATGGKTVAYLSQITITASANYGYHFTQWNDGNKENPRTVTVTENAIYTASFAKNNYTITTNSENPLWGSATGGKTAAYLDQIIITANANFGYHFTRWNDGNTQNPRTVTVTEDATYTASFDINIYTINVISEDDHIGMVMGSGMYEAFTEVNVMAATCQDGYKWSHWSDGVQLAGRRLTLTSDTTLVAYFSNAEESCVEVDVNNHSLGQADILVMATPNAGARFVEWSDGEKSNPRIVTYLEPVTYVAIFEEESNQTSVTQLPTSQDDRPRKIILDNQVYILRGDKTYSITGQEVK